MNPWQMAQQIREELTTVAWPTGNAAVVFGADGVRVFSGFPNENQIMPGFPWCLVGINTGTHDEDHPEFIEQGFSIVAAVNVTGEPIGEFSMIGGAVGDLGESQGRGILEIAERVRSAVQNLTGADGAKILLSATSTGAPSKLSNGTHVTLDELTVSALCTSALDYAAPQSLTRVGTAWSWEGSHVSDRFDFRRYTLGYVDGGTPAETIADLDVTEYQGLTASTTQTVVTGKTYSVFAEYSARKHTSGPFRTEGKSSGSEVGAFLVEP